MSNGESNVSVSWKWLAITLAGIVITIGGWLYVDMRTTVTVELKSINQSLIDIKTSLAEYKTQQKRNTSDINDLRKKHSK